MGVNVDADVDVDVELFGESIYLNSGHSLCTRRKRSGVRD